MIITRITNLQKWVNSRSTRERVLLIFLGWALIYTFWYLFVSRSLSYQERELKNNISAMQNKVQTVREQAKVILEIATKYSTAEQLESKKALSSKAEYVKKNIISTAQSLTVEKNVEEIVRDILNQPTKGIILVNVKGTTTEALIPPNVDTSDIPPSLLHLYKHGMDLEFQSDYFDAVSYLGKLENLTWHLYWDSLEYKVTDYPKASVLVKFYILVNEAG